jgi:hypothetical protein
MGPVLTRFSLVGGATSTVLSSLKLKFAKDAIVKEQFLGTAWWCPLKAIQALKANIEMARCS